MAIRIDENTIFEDGRMKKISEVKAEPKVEAETEEGPDRKSTRLNSSHTVISYAVFCLK